MCCLRPLAAARVVHDVPSHGGLSSVLWCLRHLCYCRVRRGPFCLLTCLRSWSGFWVSHSPCRARQETIFDHVLLVGDLRPYRLPLKSFSCAADSRPLMRVCGHRVCRRRLRDRAPQSPWVTNRYVVAYSECEPRACSRCLRTKTTRFNQISSK